MDFTRKTGIALSHPPALDYAAVLTGDVEADCRRVSLLLQTISDVNGNLRLEDLVESVIDRSLEVTGAERAILLLFDEQNRLCVRSARDRSGTDLDADLSYSHSVPARVIQEGRGVCQTDTAEAVDDDVFGASIVDLQLRTIMCVPLRVRERMLGLLYVDSKRAAGEFDAEDLTLFEALANQMAVALDNARLVDHYVDLQRKRHALSVAREVQRALLPQRPPSIPGLDIYTLFEPCDETSGDYFDYVPRTAGPLGLAVGDVSGHGIAAALVMASAHALLRTLTASGEDLGEVVSRMNDFLAESTTASRFMSLFYGELDPRRRTLRYVRAGHDEPLLYRVASDTFEELTEGSVVLGIQTGVAYEVAGPVRLEPGDLLLLYTDGLVEAHGAGDEQFGIKRVKEVLRACRDQPARDVVLRAREALGDFVGERPLDDDVTMMLVKVERPAS